MGADLKKGSGRETIERKTQWNLSFLVTEGKIKSHSQSQSLSYLLAFGTKHVAELSLKPPKD